MITLNRGLLIAIEGIDGAGKTTQARAIGAALESVGIEVVQTKEPTAGPHGQRLRDSARTGRLPPVDEFETFVADRKEHVTNLIGPALARGAAVIVDRYYFSSAAYQGARGLDVDHILIVNQEFAPAPDVLLLLEVDPSVGVARIRHRGDEANLFEREEDLRRSAEIFRRMDFPFLLRTDGHQAADEITRAVVERLYLRELLDRTCREEQVCKPGECRWAISGECAYTALGQLAPVVVDEVEELNRISADPTMTAQQKTEAVLRLLRPT